MSLFLFLPVLLPTVSQDLLSWRISAEEEVPLVEQGPEPKPPKDVDGTSAPLPVFPSPWSLLTQQGLVPPACSKNTSSPCQHHLYQTLLLPHSANDSFQHLVIHHLKPSLPPAAGVWSLAKYVFLKQSNNTPYAGKGFSPLLWAAFAELNKIAGCKAFCFSDWHSDHFWPISPLSTLTHFWKHYRGAVDTVFADTDHNQKHFTGTSAGSHSADCGKAQWMKRNCSNKSQIKTMMNSHTHICNHFAIHIGLCFVQPSLPIMSSQRSL